MLQFRSVVCGMYSFFLLAEFLASLPSLRGFVQPVLRLIISKEGSVQCSRSIELADFQSFSKPGRHTYLHVYLSTS
ncbi:hypothetical protein C8R43DRAFT_576881 [Mycena crocata]|nr:hypothetical protein C8R43DRAFT_576881 [Mycena crocata]